MSRRFSYVNTKASCNNRAAGLLGILVIAALTALAWPSVAAARYVYVAINGPAAVGQYGIGSGGLLSALLPPTVATGNAPNGVAVSTDGKSVYVANASSNNVSQFDVGAGGLLTAKTPATASAGTTAVAIALSPDGRSAYVANYGAATVTQYDVDGNGRLTAKTPATVATGPNPRSVAITPDGKSAYVVNNTAGNVSQYDVGAGGLLTAKAPPTVATGNAPTVAAISPDGGSLYVTNASSNNVSQFDVGAGGLLAAKTPATASTGTSAVAIALSPDGRSAYVASYNGNSVKQFDVDGDGRLTAKTPATVAAGSNPDAVAIAPDGKSAYVTNELSGNVSQYDIGTGGLLSAKTPTAVPAGSAPTGIAVTPDQSPSAAFSATAGGVGTSSRFDGSGSSDPDGSVARFDWEFGDGSSAVDGGATPAHTYGASGTYTVRLTVTDDAGCSVAHIFTGQMAYCSGGAAVVTHDVVIPPAISKLKVRPQKFRAASKGGSIARKRKTGATVSYNDSQAATMTFTVLRAERGKLSKGRCVKAGKRNEHAKRCTRYRSVGSFKRQDRAGSNRFRFSGRVRRRKLSPGRYRLQAIPRLNGHSGAASTAAFRIIR